MRVYMSLRDPCPLDHPRCRNLEGTYDTRQFAKTADLETTLTSPPYFIDDDTHYHTLYSLRERNMPYPRYISSVFPCALGHPKCQVTVTDRDPQIYRGTFKSILTGYNVS